MTNSLMGDSADPPGTVVGGDWSAPGSGGSPGNEESWDTDLSDSWILLDPEILASMLRNGLDKVLLIDSRSYLEYNTSRIQQSVNLCCSKLVKRRLQVDKVHVGDLLTQTCHLDIEDYTDVIVYDQCTESTDVLTADNFLFILLRKLIMCSTVNSVSLLKGGYLGFQAMHPSLCENKPPSSYKCTPLTSLSQPCMPVANVGPTRILPFLYLGSHRDAMSQETIQINDISYILNVSITCPKSPFVQDGHFHRIPVNDNYSAKLLPFFQQAFQFIDKVREANGSVMIHCLAGISRSPTLAIAYVMKHLRMSSDEAYRYVKDKRPTISPNFNFLGQLLEYEKWIKQAEEETRQRQEALGGSQGDGKATPIIMDLQMCSPSSPIAKATKPFTFDPQWEPRFTECEIKRDTNDNLQVCAESDSWSNVQCSGNSSSKMETDFSEKRKFSDSSTLCSGYQCIVDSNPVTPSAEFSPFPFGLSTLSSIPQSTSQQDWAVPKDCKRKSPSPAPKSPVSRSFTLSLSPVPLPSQGITVPRERKRSLGSPMTKPSTLMSPMSRSPGKPFIKPFSLPLSPVMSPDSPETSDPVNPAQVVKDSTSTRQPETTAQRHDGKAVSKPFSLPLSSVNCPDVGSSNQQKKFKQERNFHLPLTSPTQRDDEHTPQTESRSRPFVLPVSPLVSSNVSLSVTNINPPSSSKVMTPLKSPSRSFTLPLSTVSLQTNEGNKSSVELPCRIRPCLDLPSRCVESSDPCYLDKISPRLSDNTSSHRTSQTLPHETKSEPLCLASESAACKSQQQSPDLSLPVSLSKCCEASTSPHPSPSPQPSPSPHPSPSLRPPSSLPQASGLPAPSTLSLPHTPGLPAPSPLSPSSLPHTPGLPAPSTLSPSSLPHTLGLLGRSPDLCGPGTQTIYSPSAALADLHFSQSVTERADKPTPLQQFPSTSLDKLNFTPCFTTDHKTAETVCSMDVCSEQMDSGEVKSPASSGSGSSSTLTSPQGHQVTLRVKDNRAKRPLIRPNSIAFSKYPTFDLGSDCQGSPSSASSTSQDDAADTYLLQNGKRSKASDSPAGRYTERDVYRKITVAMESAMFRTQVYEASRKARSMDDILTSGKALGTKQAGNKCSPFGKFPPRCGMAPQRFNSPGIYENITCHTSSDVYQSSSSISSNGSHGSLHGSLEIIQVS